MERARKLFEHIGGKLVESEPTPKAQLTMAKRLMGLMFIVMCIAAVYMLMDMIVRWSTYIP